MSSTQQLLLGEGAGGSGPPVFIEDVFSTYLYTGNGATYDTIVNGIDLSGKGGLVWTKSRSAAENHRLEDTVRGAGNTIASNLTAAQNAGGVVGQFNNNGFTVFGNTSVTYASWTFRKQPKFFDVVTYTGTGSAQTIAHSLGSVPGCIIVKRTNTTSNWRVYHRSLTSAAYMVALNQSAGEAIENGAWNSTAPTSSVFTVGSASEVNASGSTYVAYVFAHDAGGFGLLGTDNVISCGSFTTNGSGVASVNLGYEPQWVVAKAVAGGTGSWVMQDNMRGFTASPTVYTANPLLFANSADSEATFGASTLQANSTGFTTASATYDPSVTYIYIAIRRGPMKVPTLGTSVFVPVQYVSSTSLPLLVTTGFPVDMIVETIKGPAGQNRQVADRLRGTSINTYRLLDTDNNGAENTGTFANSGYNLANNTGYQEGFISAVYGAGYNCITWNFRRAPSFFDAVCYTGTGVAVNQLVKHNLTVQPQLLIVKVRSTTGNWNVDANVLNPSEQYAFLNLTNAFDFNGPFAGATPTEFYATSSTNTSGQTFVAYLFATCAGVSKVGSYTGAGGSQSIACGFTGGARFVLIKRTDSTGDWWVWDSSRGMVSGTDPRIGWNIQTGESNNNWVFTEAGGFQIVTTDASVNASGGKYLFLAIA
jgi:hypothetical protein